MATFITTADLRSMTSLCLQGVAIVGRPDLSRGDGTCQPGNVTFVHAT